VFFWGPIPALEHKLTNLFAAAKIGIMQSKKTSKKTSPIPESTPKPAVEAMSAVEGKPKKSSKQAVKPAKKTEIAKPKAAAPKRHRKAAVAPQEAEPSSSAAAVGALAAAVGGAANSPKPPSRNEVAALAHSYWEARGRQHGSPEEDWLRAESELLSGR
jgi:hypothetical protein